MIKVAIAKRFEAAPESAEFSLEIEFEAVRGVTALFGPSGSGKTLTLDSIAGFVRPDSGRILIDDRIVFDAGSGVHLPPQQRACGYVFQNHALFPHMTLRENMAFAAAALPRLERHRRIAEQLERFGLAEMAGRCPHQLSGGQRQRGSIARALISAPRLILLDEPARGMDAVLRNDLHTLIGELRASLEVPILLVTHDAEECFALANQVLVYDAGRIIHRGAPLGLLTNPGTETVARLLGDFNVFEAEVIGIDPGRQSSRLLMWGHEFNGPNLKGCFKGDRIHVCVRPEELKAANATGENRIPLDLKSTRERAQCIRADFGNGILVDVPRSSWAELAAAARDSGWFVELPTRSIRQLAARNQPYK